MLAARWREHFETLLNGGNEITSENRINIDKDGQVVEPTSLDEDKRAIMELENNKAAGMEELPAE